MANTTIKCNYDDDCEYKAGRYDEVLGETEGDGECLSPTECEHQVAVKIT